jgi:hypothetical protein
MTMKILPRRDPVEMAKCDGGKKGLYPPPAAGRLAERAEDRKPSVGGLPCMRASRRQPPHRPETHAHGYPWAAEMVCQSRHSGCCDAQPLPLVHAAKPRKKGGMLARRVIHHTRGPRYPYHETVRRRRVHSAFVMLFKGAARHSRGTRSLPASRRSVSHS